MEFGYLLMYSELFGKRNLPAIDDFIKGRCDRLSLEWICYALGVLHHSPVEKEKQKHLLNLLLSKQSKRYKYAVYFKLGLLNKDKEVLIFDRYILMQLLCKIIVNYDPNLPSPDNSEQHRFIFEAVILANEECNIIEKPESSDKLDLFCAMSWPLLTRSSYYRIRRDFVSIVSQGVELIRYFASEEKYKSSFKEWQWLEKSETLEEYLVHVISLYLAGWNKKLSHQNYRFPVDLHHQNPWTKQVTLDLRNGPPNNFDPVEFRTLRSKPILQLEDQVYFVSNWDFVLDKLSVGMLFDVFYNTSLHDSYRDRKGSPRFDTFKGKVGFHFAEKYMSKILEGSIAHRMDNFTTGDPAEANNVDFYFRRDNHICLCEYKDALAIKSGTYSDIREQIDKKIGGDKGIGQLAKLIIKLQEDINVFEPGLSATVSKGRIDVYPIILVYDAAFSMPGMNDYLNRTFKTMLPKTDFYVHNLIVVDVDYLLGNYDNFLQSRKDLFKMMQQYYRVKFRRQKKSFKPRNFESFLKQFDAFSEINKFRRNVTKLKAKRNHLSLFNKVRNELIKFVPEKLPGENPEQL